MAFAKKNKNSFANFTIEWPLCHVLVILLMRLNKYLEKRYILLISENYRIK